MTTEKELDTVEVLKAIQKAKEVKSKLSNPEKKVSEDCRLSAAPCVRPSSSPPTVAPSSTSLPQPILSNQGNHVCSFLPSRAKQAGLPGWAGVGGRCWHLLLAGFSHREGAVLSAGQLPSEWHMVGVPGLISAVVA